MFREMRRKGQQLSMSEAEEILRSGTSGVLALLGDGGYPYAVPMSYVYSGNRLYFHGALSGHRADAVRRCDKASFCVIAQDEVLPEKYTTAYKSVIVFGRIRAVESDSEKRAAAMLLGEKYRPGHPDGARAEADRWAGRFRVYEMEIEHMTGKEGASLQSAE